MVTLIKNLNPITLKEVSSLLLFSAATSEVNSLKRSLFLLSSYEPLPALVRAESPLTNKSDMTVGLFHCWMKQREKLICSFSTCTEKHPGKIRGLLGVLGLPSRKSLHQNPQEKSTKWEELLILCQPNLSTEFCSSQKDSSNLPFHETLRNSSVKKH